MSSAGTLFCLQGHIQIEPGIQEVVPDFDIMASLASGCALALKSPAKTQSKEHPSVHGH